MQTGVGEIRKYFDYHSITGCNLQVAAIGRAPNRVLFLQLKKILALGNKSPGPALTRSPGLFIRGGLSIIFIFRFIKGGGSLTLNSLTQL